MTGRSVHSQRRERLWRDLFVACTSLFYNLFYFMEDHGLLDPTDEIHLFALHYVFLPKINKNLEIFRESHNKAPLSTEKNRSPEQLWLLDMLNRSVEEADAENNQVWQKIRFTIYILYTVHEMSIHAVSIGNHKMCPVYDNIMKLNHSWIKHACYPN